MKVGDLVRVTDCVHEGDNPCGCLFCGEESNRIGIVLARYRAPKDDLALHRLWTVMFDIGPWELYDYEVKIINESR